MRTFTLAGLLLLALGCSGQRFAYAPVSTTSAEIDGRPIAVVTLPADAPKGELKVASLGVAEVTPPANLALLPFRALFVRIVVANQSDETWTVDEAELHVDLEEKGTGVTSWALTTTGERPPIVLVAPGRTNTLDVSFPLGVHDAGSLPRFELVWTLHAGARALSGRVPFARQLDRGTQPSAPIDRPSPPPYRLPDRFLSPPPIAGAPCPR